MEAIRLVDNSRNKIGLPGQGIWLFDNGKNVIGE
jgi:hypothetical protein